MAQTKKKDDAAVALGRRGGLKGGKARDAALSTERKKEIARKAAEARWGIRATHKGVLSLGKISIDCAVLEDGRRVLTTMSVLGALGRTKGGWDYRTGAKELPVYVRHPRLEPFISDNLRAAGADPIEYRVGARQVTGVEASLLHEVCEVWLKAREAGALHPSQLATAQKAEILVRALAKVGIIALVDEATGYQYYRARNALAEILENFVARELAEWVKVFPDEYYVQLFRLYGYDVKKLSARKPQWMGRVTDNVVYKRLAPGVLDELRRRNPKDEKGRRKARHHQWLTREIGHPKLKEHIAQVIVLMRAAVDKESFQAMLDRALPKVDTTLVLPGVE